MKRIRLGEGIFYLEKDEEHIFIIKMTVGDLILGMLPSLIFIFAIYLPIIAGIICLYTVIKFMIHKEIIINRKSQELNACRIIVKWPIGKKISYRLSKDAYLKSSLGWQMSGEIYEKTLVTYEIYDNDNKILIGTGMNKKTIFRLKEICENKLNMVFKDETQLNRSPQ